MKFKTYLFPLFFDRNNYTLYKKLFDHIKEISPDYPEDDLNQLSRYFDLRKMCKKELFLRQGDICRFGGFVLQGCFRYFTINSEAEEITTQFGFEYYWIGEMKGLVNGNPSKYSIQALEESSILTISSDDYNYLLKNSHPFAIYKQRLRANAYQARIDHSTQLLESAETQYKNLLNKFPFIIQRVPQYHIASFLGITPESLSRIRKTLTK